MILDSTQAEELIKAKHEIGERIIDYGNPCDIFRFTHEELLAICAAKGRQYSAGDWYGCSSYQEAMDRMTNGNPGTLKAIELTRLPSEYRFQPNGSTMSDTGLSYSDEPCGSFDVGEYLQGGPEFYMHSAPKETPVVTLAVNVGVTALVEAEEVLRRGKLILPTVEALEASGYGVRIIAYNFNSDSHVGSKASNLVNIQVTIKEADQYLSRELLAYLLCEVATYRVGFFSIMDHLGIVRSSLKAWTGSASSQGDRTTNLHELKSALGSAVIIPGLNAGESAEEYMTRFDNALQESIGSADNR